MEGTRLAIAGALLGGVLMGGGAAWFGRASLEAKASPVLPPTVSVPEHKVFTGPAEPLPAQVTPKPAAPLRVATQPPAHKGRSVKKSAVIIAGSAGTAAAIGGTAAGGRGAVIGAISGGAAGVVYDQVTRNRR